ncbi:Uncharacterized conserved protein YloU, alkaline shock protein (Asp23) family [Cohnella sp. OV330]|uniref:alkaline shock response membrane anchor protein AmaP n=1 Tax=Cohnella sp. OV330 TaxID=1855288 RepID=UPI0008EC493F|nr:alkaline shock response membrane anchor protein AmaP [Cohnella sp. OV330]SFB20132.1 Uncharacterized conserved protein YloU, alkaline shock protein (Asp23) family [Cohnella sp. OV330]
MFKVWDRLLLFIYSLAIVVASAFVVAVALGAFSMEWLTEVVDQTTGDYRPLQVGVIVVAAVLILISLRFLVLSVGRLNTTAPTINQRTEHGDIQISIETVENLALKAASRSKGVKDLRARVRVAEAGLHITIRAFVDGEGSIPTLSEDMQRTVSQQIEETTGIPVSDVTVYIANVTQAPTTFKSRVE